MPLGSAVSAVLLQLEITELYFCNIQIYIIIVNAKTKKSTPQTRLSGLQRCKVETNQKEEKKEYEDEQSLKCDCGWDGDQLLRELENAEKEISEDDLPFSGKYNFERLLKDIEDRGITPQSQTKEGYKARRPSGCAESKANEAVSLRYAVTVIRTSIAAATAASLVLFIGISSIA